MRKVILITIVLFSCSTLSAASNKNINLSFLKNQTVLNCVVDFSQVTYYDPSDGKDFLSTASAMEFEEWKKTIARDESYYLKRFHSGVVSDLNPKILSLGNIPTASYTVRIEINKLTRKGDVYANIVFLNTDTNENLCSFELFGDGGTIGTLMNLVGDGMRSLGEDLGEIIKKKRK